LTGAKGEVRIMTLDPGHFHAALVQKTMYDQVSPTVNVYASQGPDLQDHLSRIQGFNTRETDPTAWIEKVYTGPDFLERMIQERSGNVVVISGNNARKTDSILRAVQAGLHVLADKPMVISPEKYPLLEEAFATAQKKGVLLYDIMTERYEITTILQKELAQIPEVFGDMEKGTPEDPAVTKESVHHFYKSVAGNPLVRPGWFFDVRQQGEGMVDVSTHLVDLIQWECFPEQILSKTDVKVLAARRWPTSLTLGQFQEVTRLKAYPAYLNEALEDGQLKVYSNGQMTYTLKGVHARVSVTWNYRAPEGAGDTHTSILRGTRSSLVIRQDKEEKYQPTLYVETREGSDIEAPLKKAVAETLQARYPGIGLQPLAEGRWRIEIPAKYRVGHEAHFSQVMERYLRYLAQGRLPDWEVPNMIAKYYTTTTALRMARR
jgi:predicted dehydrogenase